MHGKNGRCPAEILFQIFGIRGRIMGNRYISGESSKGMNHFGMFRRKISAEFLILEFIKEKFIGNVLIITLDIRLGVAMCGLIDYPLSMPEDEVNKL